MKFLGVDGIEIVNLAHTWAPGKICHYPGDPEYQLREVATIDDDGYALNYVSVGEHTGTHWGAPSHFNAGAAAAQDLDAEDFFLPAVTIDIERQAAHDTDYAVSVDDLQAWVASTARSRTSAPSYSTPAGTSGGPPSSTPTSTTTASPATRDSRWPRRSGYSTPARWAGAGRWAPMLSVPTSAAIAHSGYPNCSTRSTA